MSDAMAAVLARITALDARLRGFGAGQAPGVGGAFSADGSPGASFASVLATADRGTPGFAAVSGTDAAALDPAAVTPLPWLGGRVPTEGADGPGALGDLAGASGLGRLGAVASASGPLGVVWPVTGARLSQAFGPTDSPYSAPATVDGIHHPHFHDGIDLAGPLGRPVRAMASGEVVFAGRHADGAVVVRIRHADGSEALYAHLGAGLDVRAGDRVVAGERLGVIGMTGRTTGPHLHLELRHRGEAVDPEPVLRRGTLPGGLDGSPIDASVLAPSTPDAATARALARFDALAADIPYAAEIRSAAVDAGLDPLLLASLVRHESGFRPDAVSSAGAMGLTQLMPATAEALGVEDPFDAAENVAAGARYLATNLRIYGRVDLALAAYQAGKGAVAAAGGIPDSPTTRRYIDRILGTWSGYLEAAA